MQDKSTDSAKPRTKAPKTLAPIVNFPSRDDTRSGIMTIENQWRNGFPSAEYELILLFGERYCSDMRYCTQHECFYLYDGMRWIRDEKMVINRRAGEMIAELFYDIANEPSIHRRKEKTEIAIKFQNQHTIRNIVQGVIPQISISVKEFDSDHALLNLENGTLNTNTGVLLPHNQSDLITKICRVPYTADATAPNWEKTIQWATGNDAEYIEYMRRLFFYCLTGEVQEEQFYIALGAGSNGKSKIFGTLQQMLKDYSVGVAAEALMNNVKADPRADGTIAALRGVRLAISSESQDGHQFNEALMKELTGRDILKGRAQYEKFIEFDPTHKLILFTNHKPYVKDTSQGFWRRARLLPFNHTARDEGDPNFQIGDIIKDPHLDKKLEAEMSGILNWILAASQDYHANGVGTCQAVEDASKSYRAEMDVIGAFLSECATIHKDLPKEFNSTNKELFDEYKSWCMDTNRQAGNRMKFIERMREKGIQQYNEAHTKALKWRGVSVNNAAREWTPPVIEDVPFTAQSDETPVTQYVPLRCPSCQFEHTAFAISQDRKSFECKSCRCQFDSNYQLVSTFGNGAR